jgi:hypothetical protein
LVHVGDVDANDPVTFCHAILRWLVRQGQALS